MIAPDNSPEEKLVGVYVALVTDNQDPEKLGRVKVTFPWRGTKEESFWARVASFAGGQEAGAFFLPEVGDEVLVAFERGELEFPVVLGSLWNGRDKPPFEEGRRLIRSRKGHEVVLHDQKGEVCLRSAKGREITLKDSGEIIIKDPAGNEIHFTENPPTLRVKGGLKVEIEAQELKLKGLSVEISADTTLVLKGALVQIN